MQSPSQQVRANGRKRSHSQTSENPWSRWSPHQHSYNSPLGRRKGLSKASTTSFSEASQKLAKGVAPEVHAPALRCTRPAVEMWCPLKWGWAICHLSFISASFSHFFHLFISFGEAVTAPPTPNTTKQFLLAVGWTAPEGRFTSEQKSLRVRASHLHRLLWSPEGKKIFFLFSSFFKEGLQNWDPQTTQVSGCILSLLME